MNETFFYPYNLCQSPTWWPYPVSQYPYFPTDYYPPYIYCPYCGKKLEEYHCEKAKAIAQGEGTD